MAYFRGFYVPSIGAVFNVAWETLKATWPENSPCMELVRGPNSKEAHGQRGEYRESVDGAEMTTLNNGAGSSFGDQKHVTMAEDSFSYQRNG
jgi:vesicular inhibitory amino acid transporter